jgi:hypothetical protein
VRAVSLLLTIVFATATPLAAQDDAWTVYVGGLTGVSTLSADGRSVVTPPEARTSLYTPENGPAVSSVVGVHFHRFVSLQASYVWNRNDLTLLSSVTSPIGGVFAEQDRPSSQHALVIDLLVYMRGRDSRVRPYFSTGTGIFRFVSDRSTRTTSNGAAVASGPITSTHAGVRLAVGIDLALGSSWSVRYTYSDTVTRNPVSERLEPRGTRRLSNFQSLVGLVRRL